VQVDAAPPCFDKAQAFFFLKKLDCLTRYLDRPDFFSKIPHRPS